MSNFDEPSRARAVSRLALLALMSAGVAGCSSDFSRMSENPWASRQQASYQGQGAAGSNEVTGSVRQPTHKVESAALPPPAQPTYGGGAGMAASPQDHSESSGGKPGRRAGLPLRGRFDARTCGLYVLRQSR